MKKYRIVTDNYGGYEVQESILKFFWIESKGVRTYSNTHFSIERAKEHIEWLKAEIKPSKQKIVYTEQ